MCPASTSTLGRFSAPMNYSGHFLAPNFMTCLPDAVSPARQSFRQIYVILSSVARHLTLVRILSHPSSPISLSQRHIFMTRSMTPGAAVAAPCSPTVLFYFIFFSSRSNVPSRAFSFFKLRPPPAIVRNTPEGPLIRAAFRSQDRKGPLFFRRDIEASRVITSQELLTETRRSNGSNSPRSLGLILHHHRALTPFLEPLF